MDNADDSLGWLLAPVTTHEFVSEYLEKQALLVQRLSPRYYESLLTLEDFDEELSSPGLTGVRVVHDGRDVYLSSGSEAGRVPTLEDAYAHYRKGATISLTHIHRRRTALDVLCRRLADTFSTNVQINAYLTPPNSRGLGKHFDTHDVLVLQIAGSKKWRLGSHALRFPLRHQAYGGEAASRVDLDQELELHQGDLLYVPRGVVHQVESIDTTSLHLTVGLLPVTYADLILADIETMLEGEAEFRAALPFGFARTGSARAEAEQKLESLLRKISEGLDPSSLVDNAVDILSHARPPDLAGHLLDLEASRTIESHIPVARRPSLRWEKCHVEPGSVQLVFHGKVVTLPDRLTQAVEFMENRERFSARELPGRLDEQAKLTLVKRLLQEGFLTLAH
jgi:ribosomal protein L16 Arg81 hydroxylase